MGRTMVIIPDDLDRKFRVAVAKKYGGQRRALGRAVAEAIELWLKQQK